MLTGDGRILIIAIQVKVKQQDNDFEDVEEEDDVFLSDEEQGELVETRPRSAKEPVIGKGNY